MGKVYFRKGGDEKDKNKKIDVSLIYNFWYVARHPE